MALRLPAWLKSSQKLWWFSLAGGNARGRGWLLSYKDWGSRIEIPKRGSSGCVRVRAMVSSNSLAKIRREKRVKIEQEWKRMCKLLEDDDLDTGKWLFINAIPERWQNKTTRETQNNKVRATWSTPQLASHTHTPIFPILYVGFVLLPLGCECACSQECAFSPHHMRSLLPQTLSPPWQQEKRYPQKAKNKKKNQNKIVTRI